MVHFLVEGSCARSGLFGKAKILKSGDKVVKTVAQDRKYGWKTLRIRGGWGADSLPRAEEAGLSRPVEGWAQDQ